MGPMRFHTQRSDQRTDRRQLIPICAGVADGDTSGAHVRLDLPNLEVPATPASGAFRGSRAIPSLVICHLITSFLVTRTSTFDVHKPPRRSSSFLVPVEE
jgi:hypothetical protein